MKLKTLLLGILLSGISLAGYAQSDLFDRFSEEKNITTVTITKSLFRMMPDMAEDASGMDISHLINKLDQMEIYTSENKNAIKIMKETVKKHIKSNKSYEVMMMVKEEDTDVSFYIEKESEEIIKSFIMVVEEKYDSQEDGDEYVIVRMLGKFTLQDLQSVVEDAM